MTGEAGREAYPSRTLPEEGRDAEACNRVNPLSVPQTPMARLRPRWKAPIAGLCLLWLGSGCAGVRLGWPRGEAPADAPLLTFDLGVAAKASNLTILNTTQLSKADERQLIRLNGGSGVLLPYKRFVPRPEAVVLVHGLSGTPADFSALVQRLDEDPRKQVYVFLYDDRGQYLERSGLDLAQALLKLRVELLGSAAPRIRIIAHSMGGIVARSALNALVDPHWFPLPLRSRVDGLGNQIEPGAAGLFSHIELVAIDTPWQGYRGAPSGLRRLVPIETSLVDMVSNSVLLTQLFKPRLPDHFSVYLVEADNRAAGLSEDSVRGGMDLDERELGLLSLGLQGKEEALKHRPDLAHLLAAVKSCADFPAALRGLSSAGQFSTATSVQMQRLLARVLHRYAGGHTSVLKNPALIERLLEDFGTSGSAV